MAYIINIPDADWSTQTVTLGSEAFQLELKYKERTQRWYLSLYNSNGDVLLNERKIVPNILVTGLFQLEGLEGEIICEHIYGSSDYPSRNNFGLNKEFELKYLTAEEVDGFIELSKEA